MTETSALIKGLFPDTGLPADCGKLYLKDVSAFGKYNAGAYAAPFSSWSREDKLGYTDPRYLIAEAFKDKLDALRREAFARSAKR